MSQSTLTNFSGFSGFSGQSGYSGPSGISGFSGLDNAVNYVINARNNVQQYGSPLGGVYSLITISGQSGLSGFANTGQIFSGMLCSGTGIPANTQVINVDSFSHCYLNANATNTSNSQILQFWQTGTLTSGSANVTNLQSTLGLYPGMYCVAAGLSNDTQILTINNATSFSATSAVTTATASNKGIAFGVPQVTNGQAASVSGCFGGGDHFLCNRSNGTTDTLQVTRQQWAPGSGPYPDSKFYMLLVSTGIIGSGNRTVEFRFEDARRWAGQKLVLSFWAVSFATTAPLVSTNFGFNVNFIQNFGSGGSPSATVTTFVGNPVVPTTLTQFTYTFTVPSVSGKAIGTTAGSDYVSIQFALPSPSFLNFALALSDFYLGPNSIASMPYKSPKEELQECQRYFEKSFPTDTPPQFSGGSFNGTPIIGYLQPVINIGGNVFAQVLYKVPKRQGVTPVIQFYNYNTVGNSWTWFFAAGGQNQLVPSQAGCANLDTGFYVTQLSGTIGSGPTGVDGNWISTSEI